ncbi:MAG: stage II sporulation protein M [Chloroflexi bacterium]|nr:stage II sporulation protein M [Chloroflexota bacterium]
MQAPSTLPLNTGHVLAIMRRELRELLSDWRIVTPIVLLSLVLPQLLVAAAGRMVGFLDDASLAERLVPFGALLVGFLPASFSLIAALESFVGERERNSLESLLAMPLADSELYLGKLSAALLAPLTSSLLAMLVYTGLLLGFLPELYFAEMTLPRLLLLILLVGCMALVMVSGAVVISTHITTVRAANLMSSFIMVPMAAVMQLVALLIINRHWPQLWLVAAWLGVLAVVLVRSGMRSFSREELLSREQRQGQVPWQHGLAAARRRLVGRFPQLDLRTPALVIARRELAEVLGDWRVLLPLGTLAVGLPAALVAGAGWALDVVGDAPVLGRLTPFAALLVGFVPASFALITAIESFVGERERNSLEALLAMPLDDQQLYAGKLLAALLVPLTGSLLALGVFLGLVRLVHPALYALGVQPAVLLQVVLMVTVINLLMVAGAVVISAHTGSVRAATLLASAVLVPTAVAIQLQALLFIARRYDVLWYALAALAVIALALIRSGMAGFNREQILSREHEDLSLALLWARFRLFVREYRPAGVAPAAYDGLPFSLRRFYRVEFPALLGDLRLPLVCALLAVVAGLALGWATGAGARFQPLEPLLDGLGATPAPSPWLALMIAANNLRVALLSNLLSALSFGLFAFLVPFVAFAQVGFVAGALTARGGSWLALGPASPLQFLLAYVLPHGLIELPAFVLSAALGLRIGAALLAAPPGFSVGQNLLWSLASFVKVWLLVLLPLVTLAAAVEGLITPLIIRALYGG